MSVLNTIRPGVQKPIRSTLGSYFGNANVPLVWDIRGFVSLGNTSPEFDSKQSLEYVTE